jgi:methylated-DNA-[protein]-cysteine S-methyltransferase
MTEPCTLTTQHTVLAMPIGDLTVVREGDLLTGLYFPHHWYKPDPVTFGPRSDRRFEGVAGQLEEYLAGNRTVFDLPLKPRGERECYLGRRLARLCSPTGTRPGSPEGLDETARVS